MIISFIFSVFTILYDTYLISYWDMKKKNNAQKPRSGISGIGRYNSYLSHCLWSDALKIQMQQLPVWCDTIHTQVTNTMQLNVNTLIWFSTVQFNAIWCDWTMQRNDAMQFSESKYLPIK